jgi:predicted dehydrogenase
MDDYAQGAILDEIQRAPQLLSYIQARVDEGDQDWIRRRRWATISRPMWNGTCDRWRRSRILPVTSVAAAMAAGGGPVREDKMSILLTFADGSVGTVHYFANGAKSYPKETLEIFGDGRVIRMENFRVTTGYGFKGFRTFRTWRQDKGHRAEIAAFVAAMAAGGPAPIPFEQIVNATRASFAAVEAARSGSVIRLWMDGIGK